MGGTANDRFSIDQDSGALIRSATPPGGRPYEHRCPMPALEEVAWQFDEASDPLTIQLIHDATSLPFTQVAVALAFLKERGCVRTLHGRKSVAASRACYEDAMIEYHALREGIPGCGSGYVVDVDSDRFVRDVM